MDKESENRDKAKKKIGTFIFVIVVLAVLYFGYYNFYGKYHIETENAYTIGNQNIVTAQVPGSIVELYLKNTKKVRKGELVAKIEDTDYKLRLEEAKIDLGKRVRDFYSITAETIQAKRKLESAQSNYNTVEKSYKRSIKLFKAGLISRQNLEEIENKYINSKNTFNQTRKQYEASRLQSKSKDVKSFPAVAATILQVKKAYLDLTRTNIYSPDNGKVAKKAVYLGEKVGAGQQLFTVVNLNEAWVEANFKETQLKNISLGNPVELRSDLNQKVYNGVVVGISGGSGNAFSLLPAQNATGNWIKITQRVPVRIAITRESFEKNGTLPLGSTMDVKVDTSVVVKDIPEETAGETYNPYILDEKKIEKIIDKIIEENSLS
jgi:membrane fusion protein (multidrug efflux system)